ncbi:hypothetical protein [Staphylococcus xylosus]|uniref:hypothetical protein n=1 Tax=Staphylococcus xylosus TaxID=1288 RepID=UPI001E56B4D2|nr:hypothetical protein [Staphylococcus xylosus]MCD8851130.1 hypothetical protein [Staphylococcus xylosus]
MEENIWYLIKKLLDNNSHGSVIKGILSYISEITNNKRLDNDNITSILNDELNQLIEQKETENERENEGAN